MPDGRFYNLCRLLTVYRTPGLAWARLGTHGPGLLVKDTRRHRLLFSERQPHSRVLRLGPFAARYVPPLPDVP